MPRACAERGILQGILPLSQMRSQILRALHYTEKDERNGGGKSPGAR